MYENYSVLFVDDEVNILNSLRRGLLEEEYTCHFADSALHAIEILESKKVHVLITDIRMPEINGFELLKHVEMNYPMVVKMVLSGYAQLPQVFVAINQCDIFNFITKPWSIEELIVIIHKALDYYILQEENAKYKLLLETKNQSYQNILKKIDDVADNAKKTNELLRICGNEILRFSKDFTKEERNIYYEIISKQYEIYDLLARAAVIEYKAYGNNQMIGLVSELVSRHFPAAVIDKKHSFECTIFTNKQMLDALLASILLLFHNEFTEYGLYLSFRYDNRFLISIVSPNAGRSCSRKSDGATIFNAKMAFIRNIVEKISDYCRISLQVLNKDGNLAIDLS